MSDVIDDLRNALAALDGRVGCGDHSCLFVKPKGMATNGGCRCDDKPFVFQGLAYVYRAALRVVDATPPEKESKS